MRRPKRWPLEQLAPYVLTEENLHGGERARSDSPPSTPSPLPSKRGERGEQKSLLNFESVFGNSHPVELEIGCGKGGYLIAAAAERSGNNFVGLEIDRALFYYVASRLAKRGLHNARVACADAATFVRDRLGDHALAAVHVYFPDPWWKKRHHKRRLWTPEFAVQCVRILAPGGKIHVATDVGEYFATMRELLDAQPQLSRVPSEERAGPYDDTASPTNFERKARARGGDVWRADYVARPSPSP